jgi:hypothetical protein
MVANMLPWSVTATLVIPFSFTVLMRSFIRMAPSRREYRVCRWRWVKDMVEGVLGQEAGEQ